MLDNEAKRELLRRILILRLFQVKAEEIQTAQQLEAPNRKITLKGRSSQAFPSLTQQAKDRTERAMKQGDFEEVRKHIAIYNAVENYDG